MSAELIYKTTSEAALQWFRDFESRRQSNGLVLDAFQKEIESTLGPVDGQAWDGTKRPLLLSRGKVVGVVRSVEEYRRGNYKTHFPGWREHERWDALVPSKNTKLGKEWARRIEDLPKLELREEASAIGVPYMVFANHRMYEAGFDVDYAKDNSPTAIYQLWGSGLCEGDCLKEQAEHPDIEWVEVPRSQWYARVEAKQVSS